MAVTIKEQRYGPTTGVVSGWAALVLCVVAAVFLIRNTSSGRVHVILAIGIAAVVIWCYVLRPRVIIREPTLLLRNAFSTWELPLAEVTRIQIKAITRVNLGEKAYDGIGVGRRVMTMVRARPGSPPPRTFMNRGPASTPEVIADLVIEQVLAASARAKEAGHAIEPAIRRWAWIELFLIGAQVVALAVVVLD